MKRSSLCYITSLAVLFSSGPASANPKFYSECQKECASCGNSADNGDSTHCEPFVDASGVSITTTSDVSQEDADRKCAEAIKNTIATTTNASSPNAHGVSLLNYQRAALVHDGGSPDSMKYEMVNGVRTPRQLAAPRAVFDITDTADGKGYQINQYWKDQLPAAGADGIRAVPAGLTPVTSTIFRNPDGGAGTTSGKLDVLHRAIHPTTGVTVTRGVRFDCPVGRNAWSRSHFMGDPSEQGAQAHRIVTMERDIHSDGTETITETTYDRDSGGTMVITGRTRTKYAFYKYGFPVPLVRTILAAPAATTGPTTTWTYHTNPAQPVSFNKPATMRETGGSWADFSYQGSEVTGTTVTKTVTGWRDNPAPAAGAAPDGNANRVITVIESHNDTGTIGREEKIQGITVSKSWGERHKNQAGEVVETNNILRGSATLTTVRTGYADDTTSAEVERGRLKSIRFADGTFELHRYRAEGDNRVETIDTGVGTTSAVTDGTRVVKTWSRRNVLIKEEVSDIASGIALSARMAIAFTPAGSPTRWAYDNDPDDYSETLYGCCGIDSERSRDGVTATHLHDGLKRLTSTTSLGVTTTRVYGHTAEGYPSLAVTETAGDGDAARTRDQGTTVNDWAGRTIRQISPDLDGDGTPETTSTTHTSPTETGVLYPNGGTSVSTTYLDGRSKSVSGTAVADASYDYAAGTDIDGIPGAVMKTTVTRPSGTAAGDLVTETYTAVGGLTLLVKTNQVVTATYAYDNLARPVLATDGDGVKSHTAYNAKGEAYRRAASRDGNDTIDIGTDIVTDTGTDITEVEGFGPAIRTRVTRRTGADTGLVTTTLRSPDGIKSAAYSPGVASPSTSQSATYLDRTDGAWTDTSTAPDGTKQTTTYANWLPVTVTSVGTDDGTFESSSTGYDALRRPETSTDSRTAAHVVRRTSYHATNGLVVSVTEDLTAAGAADHVTSFEHDNMGRTVATTLPDTTKTRHTYTLTGQSEATWGSQTYPTFATYDEQGRLKQLLTYRNSTGQPTPPANAADTAARGIAATTWLYHPNGRLQHKQDDEGKGVSYTYTPAGRILTRTWARGRLTTYTHTHGFLTGISYAGDDTTWAAYGAAVEDWKTVNGNPASTQQEKDAALAGMNSAYAAFAAAPDASTPAVGFTHDNLGRMDIVTQGGVTTADYGYTGAFLTSEILGAGNNARTLARHYDAVGRQRSLAVGAQYSTAYGYDTGGRLNRIWAQPVLDDGEPQGDPSFTYTYTPQSPYLLHTVAGPAHTVTNTWEPTRDVLATKVNAITAGTPSVPSSFAYGVNSIGQRETVDPVSDQNSTYAPKWTWGYDSMGQISTADDRAAANDRAYLFDTIGNRQKISEGTLTLPQEDNWAANALNQLTKAGGETLPEDSYDADGNQMKGRILPPGSSSLAPCVYHWDAENRLISVTSPTGEALATYAYDVFSRLVTRTTTANGQTTTARYLYDGWNRIAEYAGQSPRTTYIWGMDLSGTMQGAGGVGGLLSVSTHDPETGSITSVHYPAFDGNGNVTEYIDATEGVLAHFEYDPFGNTVVNTDTTNQFEYRFSTKPQDQATGLLYYGYRWYDPLTGRWPSRDPIGERGGRNLYGFIGNDGVDRWDELGLYTLVNARDSTKFDNNWRNESVKVSDDYTLDPTGLPSGDKCPCAILVVVHGYNNSLADAKKTFDDAEMLFKAQGGDVPVYGFAWRSDNGWEDMDESVQASRQVGDGAFSKFVRDFKASCPNTIIHMVSHSLGAGVILQGLANGKGVNGIGEVVIANAAVDNESLEPGEEFANAPRFARKIEVVTDDNDEVLGKAYFLSQNDNALGQKGPEHPAKAPKNVITNNMTGIGPPKSGFTQSHGRLFWSPDFWQKYAPRFKCACKTK